MDEIAAFSWLVALTLRGTVVLSVALGLGLLLRRSSAVARHRLLTLTAVSLLALPVLPRMLPSLELPLALPGLEPSGRAPVADVARPAETLGLRSGQDAPKPGPTGAHAAAPDTAPSPGGIDYEEALSAGAVAAWLIGVAAALVGLGRALQRERRLLGVSRPLDGPWLETLNEARRTLAITRPVRLLTCAAIETPLTCGWPRPAVFLPPIAERWPEDRRRLVVQHELVHVVRGDGLRRLAWRLVAALYWFHPLARIAERQAGLVGEHACDETVVRLGTRPSLYARHLLDIAVALRGRPRLFASALPMVERSQLERRLVMILDTNRVSSRGGVVAIACLAFLAATVLSVACATSARPEGATGSANSHPSQEAVASAVSAPAAPASPRVMSAEEESFGSSSVTTRDGDYSSFQHDLGDGRRLSARVYGPVLLDEQTGAIRDLPRGSSVLIETRRLQKGSQRMLITEEQGAPRYEWRLNGSARPVDDDARAWLEEALAAVAAFRAIGEIQGHVGSLQGQIGAIQGQIGALQGRIGAIQGEEGSLQGKIGAIQGERGSLQGQIGSLQGAIGSLQGARGSASDDLRKRIDLEIQSHEAAIRKLEAERDEGALSRRLAEAEAELRVFQQSSTGKIADLERQIHAIRSENEIGDLEKAIDSVHAEERIDEIERRVAPNLDRLKALIDKLGS